jgi:hypothetical protein
MHRHQSAPGATSSELDGDANWPWAGHPKDWATTGQSPSEPSCSELPNALDTAQTNETIALYIAYLIQLS